MTEQVELDVAHALACGAKDGQAQGVIDGGGWSGGVAYQTLPSLKPHFALVSDPYNPETRNYSNAPQRVVVALRRSI